MPIPASLVVTFHDRLPVLESDAPWLTEPGARVDTATVGSGHVVRRVRYSATTLEDEEICALVVDYWISRPSGGVAHLAMSTPLLTHEEAMVRLFDAIVETRGWVAAR